VSAFAPKAAIDMACLLGRFADALATEVKGWPVIAPKFEHLHLEGSAQSQCMTYAAPMKPELGRQRVLVFASSFAGCPLKQLATFGLN